MRHTVEMDLDDPPTFCKLYEAVQSLDDNHEIPHDATVFLNNATAKMMNKVPHLQVSWESEE